MTFRYWKLDIRQLDIRNQCRLVKGMKKNQPQRTAKPIAENRKEIPLPLTLRSFASTPRTLRLNNSASKILN
jgi:hypothetical protein